MTSFVYIRRYSTGPNFCPFGAVSSPADRYRVSVIINTYMADASSREEPPAPALLDGIEDFKFSTGANGEDKILLPVFCLLTVKKRSFQSILAELHASLQLMNHTESPLPKLLES